MGIHRHAIGLAGIRTAAVEGLALADQNPAAIAALLKPWLTGITMHIHSLRHPLFNSALCIGDKAVLGSPSNDRRKLHSWLNR